eukprot:gene12031-24571_t
MTGPRTSLYKRAVGGNAAAPGKVSRYITSTKIVSNGRPQKSVTVSSSAGTKISTTVQPPRKPGATKSTAPLWMNFRISPNPSSSSRTTPVTTTSTTSQIVGTATVSATCAATATTAALPGGVSKSISLTESSDVTTTVLAHYNEAELLIEVGIAEAAAQVKARTAAVAAEADARETNLKAAAEADRKRAANAAAAAASATAADNKKKAEVAAAAERAQAEAAAERAKADTAAAAERTRCAAQKMEMEATVAAAVMAKAEADAADARNKQAVQANAAAEAKCKAVAKSTTAAEGKAAAVTSNAEKATNAKLAASQAASAKANAAVQKASMAMVRSAHASARERAMARVKESLRGNNAAAAAHPNTTVGIRKSTYTTSTTIISNGKPQRSITVSRPSGIRISNTVPSRPSVATASTAVTAATATNAAGGKAQQWMNFAMSKKQHSLVGAMTVDNDATAKAADGTGDGSMVLITTVLGVTRDANGEATAELSKSSAPAPAPASKTSSAAMTAAVTLVQTPEGQATHVTTAAPAAAVRSTASSPDGFEHVSPPTPPSEDAGFEIVSPQPTAAAAVAATATPPPIAAAPSASLARPSSPAEAFEVIPVAEPASPPRKESFEVVPLTEAAPSPLSKEFSRLQREENVRMAAVSGAAQQAKELEATRKAEMGAQATRLAAQKQALKDAEAARLVVQEELKRRRAASKREFQRVAEEAHRKAIIAAIPALTADEMLDHAKQQVIEAAKAEKDMAAMLLPLNRAKTAAELVGGKGGAAGLSQMHAAARKGHFKTLEALIKLRALEPGMDDAINATDSNGQAPIHWAAFAGCSKSAQVLIRAGAEVSPRNAFGFSPTDIAWAKGNGALVQQLREAGGTVPQKNGLGWDSLKPFWIPDQAANVCMCCQSKRFSMFARRHHCRQCGDVICSSCTHSAYAPWENPASGVPQQKVCTSCDTSWKQEYVHSRQ